MSSERKRANLELVLLGILVGLILKTTIDHFLKDHDFNKANLREIFTAFSTLEWFQLAVFLFTFLRFVYGAYRYHEEERGEPGLPTMALDTAGVFVLFVFLYLTGLAVRNVILFYELFMIFHGIDICWFLLAQLSKTIPPSLKLVARRFALLDFISLAFLLILIPLGFYSGTTVCGAALAWLIGAIFIFIGFVDFYVNRDFYFFSSRARNSSAAQGRK